MALGLVLRWPAQNQQSYRCVTRFLVCCWCCSRRLSLIEHHNEQVAVGGSSGQMGFSFAGQSHHLDSSGDPLRRLMLSSWLPAPLARSGSRVFVFVFVFSRARCQSRLGSGLSSTRPSAAQLELRSLNWRPFIGSLARRSTTNGNTMTLSFFRFKCALTLQRQA